MDSLLFKINEDGASGRCCVEGPFSVFSLSSYSTSDRANAGEAAKASDLTCPGLSNHIDTPSRETSVALTSLGEDVPTHPASSTSEGVQTIDSFRTLFSPGHNGTELQLLRQSASLHDKRPASSAITSPISNISFLGPETPASTTLSGEPAPNAPKFLTAEVKMLLNHYRVNVLPFFSVLDNMNTPWRVLHFPKALQAACEHEIGEPTDSPANILLYAILTVSAHSLRNSQRKQQHRRSSQHWDEVATFYKGEALKLLQAHIGTISHERVESEYHELLAAMLSMVTIDVGHHGRCIFPISSHLIGHVGHVRRHSNL